MKNTFWKKLVFIPIAILIGLFILFFTSAANAACLPGTYKHIPATSGDQDLCDEKKRLAEQEEIQELREKRAELNARERGQKSGTVFSGTGAGTGNVNIGLGNLMKGRSEELQGKTQPKESMFEIGVNFPAYLLLPLQQAGDSYTFPTQFSQLKGIYNFDEHMAFGYSYINQKIPAIKFNDSNSTYYENSHHILYFGARGWVAHEHQLRANIGVTWSDSYREGTDSIEYELGIYAELEYMFAFDTFRIGPAVTIVRAKAKDAKVMAENEDAGFVRFGINMVGGIPFGYVGEY